ncbi:MAG TPA: hypothetical protein DHW49_07560, partial [Anaerolineae bacterium]|nr:hypothetical protein [Anaerolineae bacterium]
MDNKTLAYEWALDWWAKAKVERKINEAICDNCNSSIALNEGFLCKPTAFTGTTPDLICASCFKSNNRKAWQNYLPPSSTIKETKMSFFEKLFSSKPVNSEFVYCQNCKKKKGEVYNLGGTFFFCSDQCKNEFARKLSSGSSQNDTT